MHPLSSMKQEKKAASLKLVSICFKFSSWKHLPLQSALFRDLRGVSPPKFVHSVFSDICHPQRFLRPCRDHPHHTGWPLSGSFLNGVLPAKWGTVHAVRTTQERSGFFTFSWRTYCKLYLQCWCLMSINVLAFLKLPLPCLINKINHLILMLSPLNYFSEKCAFFFIPSVF